jgi:uncharacterized protein (TIGR00661 family)
MSKGNILVAPLNWGLGHATRCIPIINILKKEDYSPIIASDGKALDLLRKEFPNLEYYELPSLKIKYSKRGIWIKLGLLFQGYKLYKSIRQEQNFIKSLVRQKDINGIISDNRLGMFHPDIPSAVITHQLKVFSGGTTWLTSKLHRYFISKYDECWVPDNKKKPHLSGRLGHVNKTSLNLKYIGLLSRFQLKSVKLKYDVLILISGPESQRQIFENIMLDEFKTYKGKAVLVRGKVEDEQKEYYKKDIKVINYLKSKELETLIQESEVIIARSGYTTLMDMAKLNKKAFFIPTPKQSEQQYLAMSMKKHDIAPYAQQKKFNLNMLGDAKLYEGLGKFFVRDDTVLRNAFKLFEGE